MTGRINQIQGVGFTILFVIHLDGVTLNGNAFFTLKIHAVQHLVHHLTVGKRRSLFEHAVGQGRFTVVNMSDDAKISKMFHVGIPMPVAGAPLSPADAGSSLSNGKPLFQFRKNTRKTVISY